MAQPETIDYSAILRAYAQEHANFLDAEGTVLGRGGRSLGGGGSATNFAVLQRLMPQYP